MSKKEKSSNASASSFGYDFQSCAGIFLFFFDIKNNQNIKIEGDSEDIEINNNNGNIYAQAKSYTSLGDDPNAKEKIKKSLKTLHKAFDEDQNTKELIYITNVLKPIGKEMSSRLDFDRMYSFDSLSDEDQLILKDVDSKFPFDKFKILTLNYYGEGETKYNSIILKITDFLANANVDKEKRVEVFNDLHSLMSANAGDKPTKDKNYKVDKKKIVYRIFIIIERTIKDEDFDLLEIDDDDYIERKYSELINQGIPDFELTGSVIGQFNQNKESGISSSKQIINFVNNNYEDYLNRFECVKDEKDRKDVTKYILFRILKNRNIFNNLKRATDL